jgi:mono/diheme cytochrome c family protein
MLKRLLVTAMTAVLAVGMGYANQLNKNAGNVADKKVTISLSRTAPTSGKQMYISYCTPCHGANGKGQGPVASALKTPPNDLTVLSKSNNGKFPDTHIVAVLENGTTIPAHGAQSRSCR